MGKAKVGELDLDAIEKRASEATKGPWKFHCRSDSNKDNDPAWPVDNFLQFHINDTDVVPGEGFQDPIDGRKLVGPKEVEWGRGDYYGRDADFIAHAREDIPALIARVRELEGIIKEMADHLRGYALSEGDDVHGRTIKALIERSMARWKRLQ